jgi:quercetin dioxygenase-like cupin family protein
MKHTRLYATADGESHFEQVEVELSLADYAPPAPPLKLSDKRAATQFGFIEAPAGWTSDWHPSSARNLFVVLSGEWEVAASDGESRRFSVGDVLLVDDTIGKGHSSRVTSETASLAVMVELDD